MKFIKLAFLTTLVAYGNLNCMTALAPQARQAAIRAAAAARAAAQRAPKRGLQMSNSRVVKHQPAKRAGVWEVKPEAPKKSAWNRLLHGTGPSKANIRRYSTTQKTIFPKIEQREKEGFIFQTDKGSKDRSDYKKKFDDIIRFIKYSLAGTGLILTGWKAEWVKKQIDDWIAEQKKATQKVLTKSTELLRELAEEKKEKAKERAEALKRVIPPHQEKEEPSDLEKLKREAKEIDQITKAEALKAVTKAKEAVEAADKVVVGALDIYNANYGRFEELKEATARARFARNNFGGLVDKVEGSTKQRDKLNKFHDDLSDELTLTFSNMKASLGQALDEEKTHLAAKDRASRLSNAAGHGKLFEPEAPTWGEWWALTKWEKVHGPYSRLEKLEQRKRKLDKMEGIGLYAVVDTAMKEAIEAEAKEKKK